MEFVIRRGTVADFPAIAELDGASFGLHYSEQEQQDARLDLDPEQTLLALDQDRVVGVSGELPMRMTVPGGDVAVMGLTWVSVELTHRRRGILRTLLERQLREVADAGFAASVLTASEGGIYRRYGFGVASQTRRTVVDRRRTHLATAVDASSVRRLTTAQARGMLPALHERWRADVPGAISRPESRWQLQFLDREYHRDGLSGLFHLVHPDGFVSYRIKSDWGDGDPSHLCWLVDYMPITADAHLALWQTLLGLDLVGSIESYRVPLDDPLALLLTDFRQVRTTHLGDGLWLRPLDCAGLLAARNYALEVETVLQVIDPLLGDGRYRLRGGPDGASCERTDAAAQVRLDVAALGAVSLGGTRLTQLARAGQVSGDRAAITRLDRALLADRLPFPGSPI